MYYLIGKPVAILFCGGYNNILIFDLCGECQVQPARLQLRCMLLAPLRLPPIMCQFEGDFFPGRTGWDRQGGHRHRAHCCILRRGSGEGEKRGKKKRKKKEKRKKGERKVEKGGKGRKNNIKRKRNLIILLY